MIPPTIVSPPKKKAKKLDPGLAEARRTRGAGITITWSEHALIRFKERFEPNGVSKQDFEQRIRSPNTRWKDERDPYHAADRFRRWVQVDTGQLKATVRVVYVVVPSGTMGHPPSIRIVSVMPETDNAP